MKFAICNETFAGWPHDKAFGFAAECGYTGVEIAPFTLAPTASEVTARMRDEIRRLADTAGLDIIGLHWLLAKTEGLHVTSADRDLRRRTGAYLGELVQLCGDLGGRVMVFGSPQQRNLPAEVTHQQGLDYAQEVIETLLPALEDAGIVLAIEPLGPRETNFLNTAAEAAALIERIGSAQVRLHLDCKAMATESASIPDLIRRHQAILAHFHANDPNCLAPGFGDLDFLPIFEAMGEVGYRGWVSVEVFDHAPSVERLAREGIEYMQGCLEELAN